MRLTHISLFTGIGGIDLAAEWAGFETILMVEKDDYCQKVLRKHWSDVPIIGDIKDVTREAVMRSATLITGGFPCQPVSQAGKRKGKDDDRWLWPEMLRVISEVRPTWVVAENVTGLLTMGFYDCLSDLEGAGYETIPFVIPACGVNAPHRRDRIFIVAHTIDSQYRGERGQGREADRIQSEVRTALYPRLSGGAGDVGYASCERLEGEVTKPQLSGAEQSTRRCSRQGEDVADTTRSSQQGKCLSRQGEGELGGCSSQRGLRKCGGQRFTRQGSETFKGSWKPERRLGRENNGLPPEMDRNLDAWAEGWEDGIPRVITNQKNRVNRLRCLGNAVVPQQIYPILQAIADIEEMNDQS